MPEAAFPNTVTTETQATTQNNLLVDLSVIRTIPGYVKIAEIALNLLGFICVLCAIQSYLPRSTWFNTVAMGGFWYSSILLAFYIFHVREKLKIIPWLKIECGFCALWTLFYLIAASLCANHGSFDEGLAAAAFFGFAAMVAYGIDAWLSFRQLKGITVITASTTTSPTTPTQY